jgi:hypothetical protein
MDKKWDTGSKSTLKYLLIISVIAVKTYTYRLSVELRMIIENRPVIAVPGTLMDLVKSHNVPVWALTMV